jgi:hypothetical protein
MPIMSRILPWLLLPALLAMSAASPAQVYKWVDDKGVVNYGDKPPARGKPAQPLAENGGSVSVVPGIPREELERQRERDTQQRLRELEREVDALRAREGARDNVAPYPVPTEIYVPTYSYPYANGYGYRYAYGPGYGRRPLHPGTGPGMRPEHPIANHPSRPINNRHSPREPVPGSPAMRGGAGRG